MHLCQSMQIFRPRGWSRSGLKWSWSCHPSTATSYEHELTGRPCPDEAHVFVVAQKTCFNEMAQAWIDEIFLATVSLFIACNFVICGQIGWCFIINFFHGMSASVRQNCFILHYCCAFCSLVKECRAGETIEGLLSCSLKALRTSCVTWTLQSKSVSILTVFVQIAFSFGFCLQISWYELPSRLLFCWFLVRIKKKKNLWCFPNKIYLLF